MPTTDRDIKRKEINEVRFSYILWGKYREIYLVKKGKDWCYPIISYRKVKPLRKRKKHAKTNIDLL